MATPFLIVPRFDSSASMEAVRPVRRRGPARVGQHACRRARNRDSYASFTACGIRPSFVIPLARLVVAILVLWCWGVETGGNVGSVSRLAALAAFGCMVVLGPAFAQTNSKTTTTEQPTGQKESRTTTVDPSKTTDSAATSNPRTGQSSSSTTTQHNDGTRLRLLRPRSSEV